MTFSHRTNLIHFLYTRAQFLTLTPTLTLTLSYITNPYITIHFSPTISFSTIYMSIFYQNSFMYTCHNILSHNISLYIYTWKTTTVIWVFPPNPAHALLPHVPHQQVSAVTFVTPLKHSDIEANAPATNHTNFLYSSGPINRHTTWHWSNILLFCYLTIFSSLYNSLSNQSWVFNQITFLQTLLFNFRN